MVATIGEIVVLIIAPIIALTFTRGKYRADDRRSDVNQPQDTPTFYKILGLPVLAIPLPEFVNETGCSICWES